MEPLVLEQYCNNCRRNIAESNFILHVSHCQRYIEICNECSEPYPRKELREHFEAFHAEVECAKCQEVMQKWKLPDHENEKCSKRLIACLFCELEVPWDDIKSHENYCGSRTETCKHCTKYIQIRDMENHANICPSIKGVDDNVGSSFAKCKFCEEDIPLKLIKLHEDFCGLKPEICTHCDEEIKRRDMRKHMAHCLANMDMGHDMLTACGYCKVHFALKDIKNHEDMCESINQTCGHCKKIIPVEELEVHYKKCLEETLAQAWVGWKSSTKRNIPDLKMSLRKADGVSQTSKIFNVSDEDQSNLKVYNKRIPCAYCEIELPQDLINEHEESCEAQREVCPHCEKVLHFDEKAIHRNECPKRKFVYEENMSTTRVNCKFCSRRFLWKDVRMHEKECLERTEICESCKKSIKMADMKKHESECLSNLSSCASGGDFSSWNFERIPSEATSRHSIGKTTHDAELKVVEAKMQQLNVRDLCEKTERKIITAKSQIRKYLPEADLSNFMTMGNGIGRGRGRVPLLQTPIANVEPVEMPPNAETGTKRKTFTEDNIKQNTMPKSEFAYSGIGRGRGLLLMNETLLKSEPGEPMTGVQTGARRKIRDDTFATCPKCNEKQIARYLHEHLIKCSPPEKCRYCDEVLTISGKKDHLRVCSAKQGAWKTAKESERLFPSKRNQETLIPYEGDILSGPVMLPCEFCSQPVPFELFIQHQSGCRPDLLHFPEKKADVESGLPDMISKSKKEKQHERHASTEKRKSTKPNTIAFPQPSKRGRQFEENYGPNVSPGEFLATSQYAGFPACYSIYNTVVSPQAFHFTPAKKQNNTSQSRKDSERKKERIPYEKLDDSDQKDKTDSNQTISEHDKMDKVVDSSDDEFSSCNGDSINVEVVTEKFSISDTKKDSVNSSTKVPACKVQQSKKKQKKGKKKSRR